MKLFKEVLIETAEQAERLPIGTVAMTDDLYQVSRKLGDDGAWQRADLADDLGWDEDMIGWTALVPIEAEEEWGLVQDDEGSMDIYPDEVAAREWSRLDGEGTTPVSRLVTPWEPA